MNSKIMALLSKFEGVRTFNCNTTASATRFAVSSLGKVRRAAAPGGAALFC